ncbi:MAG: UTP--glucose-1-phosphate uridylyltransferase [Planctomycetota bacterium]|nr:UTP--glucose-1-phosphate uridylyltransferase [Planctomycetota bacterium]
MSSFDSEAFAAAGQSHLLARLDQLSGAQAARFQRDLEQLDLPVLQRLWGIQEECEDQSAPEPPVLVELGDRAVRSDALSQGQALLAEGKVACLTVAGGQGSRLGWDGPKGTFPSGPITGDSLFEQFAGQIERETKRYGQAVPWCIMTSPLNHESTVAFFEQHHHFGLNPSTVHFFTQGVMPSVDRESGKVLLAAADAIAFNPDGHGGTLRALAGSGLLSTLRRQGIEHLSYFQVDNPLVRALDPVFLGLHSGDAVSSGEVTSKAVAKRSADEKVGVFGVQDGQLTVLEYSDLDPEVCEATDAHGKLKFRAGNMAVHAFGLDFLDRLTKGTGLPFHRAIKRVPFFDEPTGTVQDPPAPNAVKYETFIFDALPLATRPLVVEADRAEEFAPIKNAEGSDSVQTSQRAQSLRAAKWLTQSGVQIAQDASGQPVAQIEIRSSTATCPEDLALCELPEKLGPEERFLV